MATESLVGREFGERLDKGFLVDVKILQLSAGRNSLGDREDMNEGS